MASVAELNRIASSHDTLFGVRVPEPLAQGEVYNPLRRGVQRKYTLNKGKKQLYDNMVQSGKLNQEKLDKYYQLVSNSNNRLSVEEKEALRPWAVNDVVFKPKPPRTKKPAPLVPHPPSYPNPRRTKVNLATYLKRLSPANKQVSNNQANPRKNKTRKNRLNLNQVMVLTKGYHENAGENDGNVHAPQRSNRSASTAASEPRESPVSSNKSRR